MTQEQALEKFQAMYPEDAARLAVSRDRMVGRVRGEANTYYLWGADGRIVASSTRSWAHVLAIAKSGDEDIWDKVDEMVEEG